LITSGIIVCRQTGEPALEGGPERPVESPSADLEQTVSALLGPLHLLALGHPLVDHHVDGRLHEVRRDALAIVRDRIQVVGDVEESAIGVR
jgi:hypothetical protein